MAIIYTAWQSSFVTMSFFIGCVDHASTAVNTGTDQDASGGAEEEHFGFEGSNTRRTSVMWFCAVYGQRCCYAKTAICITNNRTCTSFCLTDTVTFGCSGFRK